MNDGDDERCASLSVRRTFERESLLEVIQNRKLGENVQISFLFNLKSILSINLARFNVNIFILIDTNGTSFYHCFNCFLVWRFREEDRERSSAERVEVVDVVDRENVKKFLKSKLKLL